MEPKKICKRCGENKTTSQRSDYCEDCTNEIYDNDSDEDFDEDDFQPCGDCDLPDACADFGCAIKQGIIIPNQF
jgi:hypothetical protein